MKTGDWVICIKNAFMIFDSGRMYKVEYSNDLHFKIKDNIGEYRFTFKSNFTPSTKITKILYGIK